MKRCFDKYIIVAPGSDYGRAMWVDLENNKDCVVVEYPISSTNRISRLLHHIHFSFWINSRVKLPLKNLWEDKYSLNKIKYEDNVQYCIILPDVSACRIDRDYLLKLKNRNNIELVLINVNIIKKKEKLLLERWDLFSKVFSFDKEDCMRYGCIYHPTIYSLPWAIDAPDNKSDAFFVGSYTPDRYNKLASLYKQICKKGGNADFHIIGVPKTISRIEGINYNKPLPYKEVIKKVQGTNCVVEIMNPGQLGLTLRAMESVCSNKKLLTDNPTVQDLSFYKTGFIQYAQEMAMADIDFVLKKEQVDYSYNGEFSPNRLIEHIEQEFCEVEQ